MSKKSLVQDGQALINGKVYNVELAKTEPAPKSKDSLVVRMIKSGGAHYTEVPCPEGREPGVELKDGHYTIYVAPETPSEKE